MSRNRNQDWPAGAHGSVGKEGEDLLFRIMRCVYEYGAALFRDPLTAAQIRYLVETWDNGPRIPFDDRHLSGLLSKAGVKRVCGKDRRWRYLLLESHDWMPGDYAPEWMPEEGPVKPCRNVKGALGHGSIGPEGQRILRKLRRWADENKGIIPEWVSVKEIQELGFESGWRASHFSELLQKEGYQGRVRPAGGPKEFALFKPLLPWGQRPTRDQLRAGMAGRGTEAAKGQEAKAGRDPRYHGRKSVEGCPDMRTEGRGAGGHGSLGKKADADAAAIEFFIRRNRDKLARAGCLTVKQLREMGLQTSTTSNSHLSELLSKLGYPSVMKRSCDPRSFDLLGEKGQQYTRDQMRFLRRQQEESEAEARPEFELDDEVFDEVDEELVDEE